MLSGSQSGENSRGSWFLVAAAALVLCFVASPAQAQLVQGDVLAGVGTGKIKQFTPAGVLKATLDSGTTSAETTGMCFDSSANLFSTLFSISQAAKFNSAGTLLTSNFDGPFVNAESCVLDAAGNLFFGQAGSTQVRKVDSAGTLITNFTMATQNRGTDWIDLAADQCTLFYTSEGSSVKRFNVCTNAQLPDFATSLPGSQCWALRIRPNQEVLVACTNQVHRLSSAGAILQSYPSSGFTPPETFLFALNLDLDGTTFWTGGISSAQVYRINIATGAQVISWNAGKLGPSMAGLAVVGEIQVGQPTPTPTGTVVAATATRTSTPVGGGAATGIPTLSASMLGLLCLALVVAALVLMRR